jgi:hypothetical protein
LAALASVFAIREWKQMSKYAWVASNSAPKGCPMKLTSGDFLFPEGGSLYIPPEILHNGWGESVSVHVVGPDTKPLPDRVQVTFYSYLEDKFYRGEFPIPYARIRELFATGYDSFRAKRQSRITYQWIVAGVAPGGAVSVWVEGIDRRVEVFFGYAQAVALDWHETTGMPGRVDREQNRQERIQAAAKGDPLVTRFLAGIPFGAWEGYRRHYAWRPVFEGMQSPERIARLDYYNGERELLVLPLDEAAQHASRPVPSFVDFVIRWPKGSGTKYSLTFNEEETLAAFQKLGADGKPIELAFHTELVDGKSRFSIRARNADEEIRLRRVDVEFFGVD